MSLLNNSTYANEIKIRAPFNPCLSAFYPVHPCFLAARIRFRANEDLMETAPVPRLTDLKGTLNYLATNLLCHIILHGCWLFKQGWALSRNEEPTTASRLIPFMSSVSLDSTLIYYYLLSSSVANLDDSGHFHFYFLSRGEKDFFFKVSQMRYEWIF